MHTLESCGMASARHPLDFCSHPSMHCSHTTQDMVPGHQVEVGILPEDNTKSRWGGESGQRAWLLTFLLFPACLLNHSTT